MGFSDSALHIIQEGKSPELLSFFRLGFDKPTYSRTYFSAVKTDVEWEMNTSLNGGGRSCISCGKCVSVCPVDIYPQLLMKSIYEYSVQTLSEKIKTLIFFNSIPHNNNICARFAISNCFLSRAYSPSNNDWAVH